jgi:hypothetical protein
MNPLMLATSTTVDLNQQSQSLGDCLKEIDNIGHTVYQNICTGQQVGVPWGAADWLIALVLASLITAAVVGIVKIIRD